VKRALVFVALAAALAGCGAKAKHAQPPPQPRLPRALAQAWSREATGVATALAANDGCAAEHRAGQLRTEVIAAINAGRVPRALLEPLTSAVNALPARITCTPPAPTPTTSKPGKHGHGHRHGKGNDQGDGGD
jgi:hypothetical protein